MIIKTYKKLINLLDRLTKHLFCKYHYEKQVGGYCKKNNINKINKKYKREIKKYWKEYKLNVNTIFHNWYSSRNGIYDVKYIPEGLFYERIEPYFNNLKMEDAYVNKSNYKKLFPDIEQPTTIIMNMNGYFYDANYTLITKEQAVKAILQHKCIFIKPTLESGGGKNAQKIKIIDERQIQVLFEEYLKDYIVQIPLKQNEELSKIHKESINTIRIMSFLDEDKVSILSSILRMGVGDSYLDNECSGGINCAINSDGSLSGPGFDRTGKIYQKHPNGFDFNKGIIPAYDKIVDTIKKEHLKLPYFRLISWDFSVSEDGNPILIEFNLSWCGINFHQLNHGPLFGSDTDRILSKVFKK